MRSGSTEEETRCERMESERQRRGEGRVVGERAKEIINVNILTIIKTESWMRLGRDAVVIKSSGCSTNFPL